MEQITQIAQEINNDITILALVIGLVFSFLFSFIALIIPRNKTVVQQTGSTPNTNLFDSLQTQLREINGRINENKSTISQIQTELPRTTIVRYNPFRDSGVGGNQSFSLASADKNGNGFIITHLFSREMSRVSTKQITAWQSDNEMSPEEQQALDQLRK